ncbi:MAG: NADH-quinone oxidoreductase chain 1 [Acidimicrobiales bacterium]|nr:NADH-quinone oxidoreductase chain 1 [Acidimicrobiales bacterium]
MGPRYLLTDSPLSSLQAYCDIGGGEAFEVALKTGPDSVIREVIAAGLRGRGGAGFPTGEKWRSIAAGGDDVGSRYVVANGAEGEPGTFKDRAIIRHNPYQLIEGIIIAAFAVGAKDAFVAIKASSSVEYERLAQAVAEVELAGWLEQVSLKLVRGPEEYLFGEEKALLEVIEGEDPLPRHAPPYLYGLFSATPQLGWSVGPALRGRGRAPASSNPTLVNNVETLANVAPIVRLGAEWYRSMGTPESPGHAVVTVSGATNRAGVAEVEFGRPLREVLDEIGGGMPDGSTIKAVLSGVANPVITRNRLGAPMSYEGLSAVGGGLGAAGFMVFDDQTDMVSVAYGVSRFLYIESCGQCPACKFGCGEITSYLGRILEGRATPHDLEVITARLQTVTDANRCGLAGQEREVISSILRAFPEDVADRLTGNGSPGPPPSIGKIVDIKDGVVVLDDKQQYKRPDWSYDDSPVIISRA